MVLQSNLGRFDPERVIRNYGLGRKTSLQCRVPFAQDARRAEAQKNLGDRVVRVTMRRPHSRFSWSQTGHSTSQPPGAALGVNYAPGTLPALQ